MQLRDGRLGRAERAHRVGVGVDVVGVGSDVVGVGCNLFSERELGKG